VKGLNAGTYELRIDDSPVGRYTAEALSKGVNLALNAAAPQVKQAQAVAKLNEMRRSTETVLRDYAAVRCFLKHRQINPDDLAATKVFAETKMAKTGYYEGKVLNYMKNWERRGEVTAKVESLEREIFSVRKPIAHTFAVCPCAVNQ